MGLNARQQEAVDTIDGAVMVMAGAGSGKTKVLTERFINIVKKTGIDARRILAVTFTNKASSEMKERIQTQLNTENIGELWISTFHSFCARILRREAGEGVGLNKDFVIADTDDSKKIIKKIIKEHPNTKGTKYEASDIQRMISREKNGLENVIDSYYDKEYYAIIFGLYHKNLRKENLLDFDDLILETIRIFEKYESIRNKYRNFFKYIEIDEFQDTNSYQYKLIKLLTNESENLFVVGDDYQSIYSFRGAKIENINKFRIDYPTHKLILLEENYRSNQGILDVANDVISVNKNQIKKTMFTSNQTDYLPFISSFDTEDDEIDFIISEILETKKDGEKAWEDYAVLYRSNYLSSRLEQKLTDKGIPYCVFGGKSYFTRSEIKDIVAYMRLIFNNNDDFSFERIVNVPKRGIGEGVLKELKTICDSHNCHYFEAIDYLPSKDLKYINELRKFKHLILNIKNEATMVGASIDSIIQLITIDSGLDKKLRDDELWDKLENIYELKSVLYNVKKEHPNLNNEECIVGFLKNLELQTDDEKTDTKNKIRISTYHQVKGLEFKNVFMMATSEGIFPSSRCLTNDDFEEERRICYVGITRACERLYITSANERLANGRWQCYDLSRFIYDIKEDHYKTDMYVDDGFISTIIKTGNNIKNNNQNRKFERFDGVYYDDVFGYVYDIKDDGVLVLKISDNFIEVSINDEKLKSF